MKPMTDEEIESALAGACQDVMAVVNVTTAKPLIAAAVRGALRGTFIGGQDNGQAIILERADKFLELHIADAGVNVLGRSMSTIIAWVAAKSGSNGRMFGGLSQLPNGKWQCSIMVHESEKGTDPWSRYRHGASPAEALAALATWCTEHDAANTAIAS